MTDPAVTADAPDQPEPRRYDLFLRHRNGLFFKLTDQGVVPGADRLSYTMEGRWGYQPYADITAINLSSAHVYRQGNLAQCQISFRNGGMLMVSTCNARGQPDPGRHSAFYDFVNDLHQRLIASGDDRHIRFTRGNSQTRTTVLQVALAIAALLFIGLPLVLALIVRTWEPLQMLLFGVLFLWPLWQTAHKNQPGIYNPKYPPDMTE